jgi:ATP-binding cassette subfamily B protein
VNDERMSRPHFLAPELIQTSAMDCGPASLASLLAGFGVHVSYGRLREACQTDVDGTSIDTMEGIAAQLGLDAEQIMLPLDHLLLGAAEALPAILVVLLPDGFTHFVVVWRCHGPLVQVMDPAVGRRWMRRRTLLDQVYVHSMNVPAAAWESWARSEAFHAPLTQRLKDIGLGTSADKLIKGATSVPGWRPLAILDAATRLSASLVGARAIGRGDEARRLLEGAMESALADSSPGQFTIPGSYWTVSLAPPAEDGTEQLRLRGAVLVRARGRRPAESEQRPDTTTLSPELAAALSEPPSQPGRELVSLLSGDGAFSWIALGTALTLAAGGTIAEALLLRGIIDGGRYLGLVTQRLQAGGFLLLFVAALALLELRILERLAHLGRRAETRLRARFLEKIPRLHDRYFRSRPISDMVERCHTLHYLRTLPRLGGELGETALKLIFTVTGLIWLDPEVAWIAGGVVLLSLLLPLGFAPWLLELNLRVRTHAGALSRFYLDALLGVMAVRAHGAGRALRREQESLLVEWTRAGKRFLSACVLLQGLQATVGFSLAGWLMMAHAAHRPDVGGALLFFYWALSLPALGDEVVRLAAQLPMVRSLTLRALEPLGAIEEIQPAGGTSEAARSPAACLPPRGVELTLEGVSVKASGHTILKNLDVMIEAGSHVAIVGPSGAGKSTLVGLFLGWHRASTGRILVDGMPLEPERLDRLRRETAWVDPAVQLWNETLLENLLYGAPAGLYPPVQEVLQAASLQSVLERLPDGLQTRLGEGGGLVSGGEGQRVRLGRAMIGPGKRLVILDEPFRGLELDARRDLLARVREYWRNATLLCITHEIAAARTFPRVLVITEGRLAEAGEPEKLAGQDGSAFQRLLEAEDLLHSTVWSGVSWRLLQMHAGELTETGRGTGL